MGQKEMAMTGKNRIMSTGRRMTAPTSSNSSSWLRAPVRIVHCCGGVWNKSVRKPREKS
jgi:hypothetical protein